jgi:integrase
MPIYVRPRSEGKAFELRVTHERLDKPKYVTKDTREAAEALPLNARACAILNRRWPALEEIRQADRLLPFCVGPLTKATLKKTTTEVSRPFAVLFHQVGSRDLHFHDIRHEAVCRWVLYTPITSEELGRAAGMKDPRTRSRYLSLRGSEIARVLNQPRDPASGQGAPANWSGR